MHTYIHTFLMLMKSIFASLCCAARILFLNFHRWWWYSVSISSLIITVMLHTVNMVTMNKWTLEWFREAAQTLTTYNFLCVLTSTYANYVKNALILNTNHSNTSTNRNKVGTAKFSSPPVSFYHQLAPFNSSIGYASVIKKPHCVLGEGLRTITVYST